MGLWKPTIALNDSSDTPLFLRIARAVIDDVRRGRLSRGSPLPGSRALATSLGVHRNTVLAAYRELVAEGWIHVEPARGTFVSESLPDVSPRRFAGADKRVDVPSRVGFDLRHAPPADAPAPMQGVLELRGGVPDVRLVPTAALARAYRRALRSHGRAALAYGDPRGHERLRTTLATMLSATRGLAASDATVIVTRGSQMALDLVARTLLEPGDVVAVEAFGYRPAWDVFAARGARVVPIPVDGDGIRVDALEALVAKERVRAVYVTPHHQYPTTVVLAAGRRMALLELARANRIALLEDDYDHEFHYEGRPVLPLASADRAGVVVYIGTLSKVLAPGLRIGYVVAPQLLIDRLAARRLTVDRQGDHVVECAIAELLDDGEVQRHIRRARRLYAERREALTSLLEQSFRGALSFRPPAGGTAFWVKVAADVDVDAWAARSLDHGVTFTTARQHAFDGRARPFVRLGFAQLTPEELREAVERMRTAWSASRNAAAASMSSRR